MANTIFNCWQTLNMFPLSLWSWKYSYNLPGAVASETEWAGMSVFYQYCIKMLLHFQYSSYSSLTWYISVTPCDKVRCTPFSHFSYNVFNAYGDVKGSKPRLRSVDITSYINGNSYIDEEYGMPYAGIPAVHWYPIKHWDLASHSSVIFLL